MQDPHPHSAVGNTPQPFAFLKHSQLPILLYIITKKPVKLVLLLPLVYKRGTLTLSSITSLFRAPSSKCWRVQGWGWGGYLTGKPPQGGVPSGKCHISPTWGRGGGWSGKVEGIGLGPKKDCEYVFDQRGGWAGLRGLRPGFPFQLSLRFAGCDRLGHWVSHFPFLRFTFSKRYKRRELYLRTPSFCHLL